MSKLGYIHNSYGKQYNIAVANTYSSNILSGSNLPKNSLIVSAPYDSRTEEDLGIYSLLATDSEGNAVRLSYCIKEGNGLLYDSEKDSLRLNIDEKSVVTSNGKLKFDISYFIDNETITINEGKLSVNTEALSLASSTDYGVAKIDDSTIKLSDDTIYVNTEALDSSNSSGDQYGIGKGDETTINTNQGKFSVITQNLRIANGDVHGIAKADEFTTTLTNGTLSVNTQNLERGITNKYGIVKGDEETIKVQNDVLSVITENLRKSSESNFGVAKIDNRTILLNEEGQIYMNSYDELIAKIDSYKELKEKYDQKINDIREEIKNSPYEFNRKDIYLFSVNKTSMTELNKPKHMEEIIEMPEQYVIAEFNIITGCDFYISVNYDRFTNEFPPVTLVNINYNDEVEYPNSEGLGINTVYPSTNGEEKKLIITFWAKNYNNSARDRSLITTIDVTVSSIEDIGMKKTERYSVVRYNSNYELPKKQTTDEELEEEKFSISTDENETFILDEAGNKYSLDDVIPWYVNTISLYVTGKNSKTGEIKKILDGEKYSLFDYSSKAWQGTPQDNIFYNNVNITISPVVTINDNVSVVSQVIQIKKEVFPRNTTSQLTNPNEPISLCTYNVKYIKIQERIMGSVSLNDFNINNRIIKDKIANYTSSDHLGPDIASEHGGIVYIEGIRPKQEQSGYYSIPITFNGTTHYDNNPFYIQHVNNDSINGVTVPREAEDHDNLLDSYFYHVSTDTLNINIDSKDTEVEMTYGTNVSNIYTYIQAVYSFNGGEDVYINSNMYPSYVPTINFDINEEYTDKVRFVSYFYDAPRDIEDSSIAETYIGYNIVSITPSENIYLNHLYEDSDWQISYEGLAYYSYYDGLCCDKENNPALFTNFNIKINIVSEPYLTASNILLDVKSNNISVSKNKSDINIIQTYKVNDMNTDTHYVNEGEFMLTYKYYITGSPVEEPTINLIRTEFNPDAEVTEDTPGANYKYIYTITPPAKYYESNTITTNDYYIAYTYYNYEKYSTEFGWKTDEQLEEEEIPKVWNKYEILGIDKILTELSLDRGDILEAYFVDVNITKPSNKVITYAYSIITNTIFDENQIYSINTDANNYIYLLNNINDYYLPSDAQQNLVVNSTLSIKAENINNLEEGKSILINGYLSKNINNSNIYNITEEEVTQVEGEELSVPKYNLKIIDTSLPLSTTASIVYIYNHSNDFPIVDHKISTELTFDYDIDTFNSPNRFYLFTQSSDKIYTTYTPLDMYKMQNPSTRRQNIMTEYISENELWKTLKVLSTAERVINAVCQKDASNRIGYTYVNIPYLDEIGLWDSLLCTTQVGTMGLEFNTSLLGLKVEKAQNSNKYTLSTNRTNLVETITNAVKKHIGYSKDNTQDDLLMEEMNTAKKNTFDYTSDRQPYEGQIPIYEDDNCSVSQAYLNQWKRIFKDLSVLLDANGNIIVPEPPDSNATPQQVEEYNNKMAVIAELEEFFKNSYANDDLLDAFLNRTNENLLQYTFSQYNKENEGYDLELFKSDALYGTETPEYQFKYYYYNNETGEEEIDRVDAINIDPFVKVNSANLYQESILTNLYGDNYSEGAAIAMYPDGFLSFDLYYKMLIRGYDIFNNAAAKTQNPENYYLILNAIDNNSLGVIPTSQLNEFRMITGLNSTAEYNNASFNASGHYDSTTKQIIDYINTLYYSKYTTNIIRLQRDLYNNSEEIFFPAYHYFNIKDNIYNRNTTFITDILDCTIVIPTEQEVYNYQYSDGTKYYPELWYLNIDEQILNNYNTIDLVETNVPLADLNGFSAKFTQIEGDFLIAKPNTTSRYYTLLEKKYKYVNYPNTTEWAEAFGEGANDFDDLTKAKIKTLQTAITSVSNKLAEEEAYMSDNISDLYAALANDTIPHYGIFYDRFANNLNISFDDTVTNSDINANGEIPRFININANSLGRNTVQVTSNTRTITVYEYDNSTPPVLVPVDTTETYYIYNPESITSQWQSAISNLTNGRELLQNKLNEIYTDSQQLTTAKLNVMNKYNELRNDYSNAYNSFFEQVSEYTKIKAINNAELETYYSKLSHEKDIVTSKYTLLRIEYDSLLKSYLKEKILELYKQSKDYSENVAFSNMSNQSILKVMQAWQTSTINLYINGALKEIDYVLSILEADLNNIKNVDLRIINTAELNTAPLNNSNGERNVINLGELYHTNFDIFNNIIPRYKLINGYNILYIDNILDDTNEKNDYFIKYNIDTNSKTVEKPTQLEINGHQVFFGTMKYDISDGNKYIHLYEYYKNYFVKEIITPFRELDIYNITNGFELESNVDNTGNKYFKVKYGDDSVPELVIVSGYPEILYRKNQSNGDYDLSSVLYTKTNNISIENNLTMLSLQKDYMIYDNQSASQYVCSNREFFVIDLSQLDLIPYYGNMMFTSRDNISLQNLKYIFNPQDTTTQYKLLDYNLYFASSKYAKNEVNLNAMYDGSWSNESEYSGSYIGVDTFEDKIKIFSYIKDYYNDNENSLEGIDEAYTNNLIWKYCKDKGTANLFYFKLLNYEFVEPDLAEGANTGEEGGENNGG